MKLKNGATVYGQAARTEETMRFLVNEPDAELHRLHVEDCHREETLETLKAKVRPLILARESASIAAASASGHDTDEIETAAGIEHARCVAALAGLPARIGQAARESRLAAIAFLARLNSLAREHVKECDAEQSDPESPYQHRVRLLREIRAGQSGFSVESNLSAYDLRLLEIEAGEYGAQDKARVEWRQFCAMVAGLAETLAQALETTFDSRLMLSRGTNGKTLVLPEAAADEAARQAEEQARKETR